MVKNKKCSKCNEIKPLTDFYKRKDTLGKVYNCCKKCFKLYNNKEHSKLYREKWKQNHPHYHRDYSKKHRHENWQEHLAKVRAYRRTPSGYYTTLKETRKRFGKTHKVIITREEFVLWDQTQKRICYYCKIPEQTMLQLPEFHKKSGTGDFHRLTIDRKDNDQQYTKENIVLACPVCNTTKGKFFSPEEFKLLAKKFITPRWQSKIIHNVTK